MIDKNKSDLLDKLVEYLESKKLASLSIRLAYSKKGELRKAWTEQQKEEV